MFAAELGDAVVDDLRRLDRDVERHRVVALQRRRRDHLDVDGHRIEIGKPVLVTATGADIGGLLLGERLRFRRGEMEQRNARHIEMRGDEFRRLRNVDMGVDVDGDAFRPQLAPGLAVLARSGRTVLVPLLGHGVP